MSNLKTLLMKDIGRFKDLAYLDHSSNTSIRIFLVISRYFITNSAFRSIFFYRILNNQYAKNRSVNKLLWFISLVLTEIKIPYTAKIGGGLLMPHPKCIYVHSQSEIGENFTISQGVTIGGNIHKTKNGKRSPIIGDNVLLGAGAKVLGPVMVGDNSIIGANAVVVKDIPENSVAVGVPAKVVKEVETPYPQLMGKMRGY